MHADRQREVEKSEKSVEIPKKPWKELSFAIKKTREKVKRKCQKNLATAEIILKKRDKMLSYVKEMYVCMYCSYLTEFFKGCSLILSKIHHDNDNNSNDLH